MDTINVPVSLIPQLVNFIKASNEILKDAVKTHEKSASDETSRKSELLKAASTAATELIESGMLTDSLKDKAVTALSSSHLLTLENMAKVARSMRPFAMGKAVATTTVVGGKSAADTAFEQRLGL